MLELISVIICAGIPTVKIRGYAVFVASITIKNATKITDQMSREINRIFQPRFLVHNELKTTRRIKQTGKGKTKQHKRCNLKLSGRVDCKQIKTTKGVHFVAYLLGQRENSADRANYTQSRTDVRRAV